MRSSEQEKGSMRSSRPMMELPAARRDLSMRCLAIALLAACASAPLNESIDRSAILRVMSAAADWQLAHPSKHPPYDWTQAPFWIALNVFAPLSSDPQRYLAAV